MPNNTVGQFVWFSIGYQFAGIIVAKEKKQCWSTLCYLRLRLIVVDPGSNFVANSSAVRFD